MKALALVISGLLLAAPAFAQAADGTAADNGQASTAQPQGSSSGTSADSSEQEERRICRRVETNTGSRVPFRTVCLTERQWETYRRQN